MNRLAVVVDDYSLAALPGLDAQLAHAGVMVFRSFKGLPNPQLLRRMPEYDGAAVVSGRDRMGLVSRLETATATLSAPVIAVLPHGVEQSVALRGPGVVDLIPAGTRHAAERVALMARVPIVSSGHAYSQVKGAKPQEDGAPPESVPVGPPRWTIAVPVASAGGPAERLTAIASSTGGVWVLASLLKEMAGRRGEAVLLAQHMEPEFVGFFADWLTSVSGWKMRLVDASTPIEAGVAYLAVGGRDLCVDGGQLVSAPPSSRYVPCADRLFKSLAASFGSRCSGVVLSGMGSDGAEGLAELARRGGRAICQAPDTAIVPSMPESALRKATGARSVAPEGIAAATRYE